ncbi:MAG: Gx transporter family protein [Clostridia bacterium]|nr:Gx transporter family protein [Clostridia bacterium]
MSIKRLALLSILTALALIMFFVESMFPPLFVPGAKMGLSNVVTLLALLTLRPLDAMTLIVVRTVLGATLSGTPSAVMYSLPAGLASAALSMALLRFVFPRVSLVAISAAAAVVHNAVQNVIYCLVTGSPEMLVFLPPLALAGAAAGAATGYAVICIVRVAPLSLLEGGIDGVKQI